MTKFTLDPAKLLAAAKHKQDSIKQKAKTIKPKPGNNRYIILHGWEEGNEYAFYHDFGQHYIKDAAGSIQAVYPCLSRTYNQQCPVCDQLATAAHHVSDDDTAKLLKDAAAGQSYLLNVLALDDGANAATPQILEIRRSVLSPILALVDDWGAAMFDPENPQIIVVGREGSGLNTEYSVQISAKKHAIDYDEVYAKINNLSEYVRQENEEQLRRALGAINANAGLLAPPSGADAPRTVSPAAIADRRDSVVSKSSASEVALDDELDDLLASDDLDALFTIEAE